MWQLKATREASGLLRYARNDEEGACAMWQFKAIREASGLLR